MSVLDKGSWYDQKKLESEHLFLDSANTSEEIISSSQRKINNAITVEKGSDDSDVETDDETVSFDGMVSPKHRWIISLDIMERHLQDVSVCRWCGQGLRIVEEQNCRAGLGTKLHFKCTNEDCFHETRGFNTTEKNCKIFIINRQAVLGEWLEKADRHLKKYSV